MIDFEKYIQENGPENRDRTIILEIEDIEHDLFADINSILKEHSGSHFIADRFKYGRHSIDIFYPGLVYPGNKSLIEHPDNIRFLLSLYPDSERLEDIDKIILQPRHIEVNGTELVSIYVRSRKILVLYLHRPYLYPIEYGELDDYSFIPFFIPQYISSDAMWSGCVDSKRCVNSIPPLWHILSFISFAPDNRADKFFLTFKDENSDIISESLENISGFYARHGY